MALHHKLCHTLGGMFDLPHAQLHTAVLPHVVAYNQSATSDAMKRVSAALGAKVAAQGLYDLSCGLGATMALRDLGMREDGIEAALKQALLNPYWNPRALEREPLRALLSNAYHGNPPPQAY
jgi:alcohol dehydrogenase class IV